MVATSSSPAALVESTPVKAAAAMLDMPSTGAKRRPCPTFRFERKAPPGTDDAEDEALERCASEVVRAMWEDRSVVMVLFNA